MHVKFLYQLLFTAYLFTVSTFVTLFTFGAITVRKLSCYCYFSYRLFWPYLSKYIFIRRFSVLTSYTLSTVGAFTLHNFSSHRYLNTLAHLCYITDTVILLQCMLNFFSSYFSHAYLFSVSTFFTLFTCGAITTVDKWPCYRYFLC